ncbi:MAG TPA: TraG/TraD/VirD4 family protein [Pirellulales bacterium]|nr:TraG/TraD/VirD4 family protein [Pirellulales bacterium]
MKIHFVIDEAGSSLGKMDPLATALTVGRSAGIRLQLYYQDLGQLKKCWPDGADQTLLANVTQIFFGVNDPQTADYVSSRLGDETLVVVNGGTSGSTSTQSNEKGQASVTRSYNWNEGWQQQARRLLKPEEVAALSPRTAIIFAPGMPPLRTTLLRYYEERLRPPSRWRRFWVNAKLAADCVALLIVAIAITVGVLMVKEQYSGPHGLPGGPQQRKVDESWECWTTS